MSKELQQFYIAMNAWLDAGAPIGGPMNPCGFKHMHGLCANLFRFIRGNESMAERHWNMDRELTNSFAIAGLNNSRPFNNSVTDWACEVDKYQNPLRIKWIKDHLPKEPE